MDRLTATRVFVTVVEHGSLTQAAERLEMSTAMVSRYLAAMENWLGALAATSFLDLPFEISTS